MTNKTVQARTLEEYLQLPYTVRVVPASPTGYVASVEELPGCITQTETWAEAGELIRDAMRCWIGTALEDGLPVPEPVDEASPAKLLLRLPRSLHKALGRAAEADGTSLNQFLVYQLARAIGEREGRTTYSTWIELEAQMSPDEYSTLTYLDLWAVPPGEKPARAAMVGRLRAAGWKQPW
jgi:antitoxin HicB